MPRRSIQPLAADVRISRVAENTGDADRSVRLMQAIVEGQPGAEEDLVRRFYGAVSAIVASAGPRLGASEDLAQETFRLVFEKIRSGDVRQPERLAGFICGVARNLAIAERRRAAQRPVAPAATDPGAAPSQLADVLERETARTVRDLLRELKPERDREILFRFYLDEQDKETICAELGLTSLHFNRVLYRARERFRELWDRRTKI
jgi:RNA polymerase sigma-70 factor, ECF subfamily